MLKNDNTNLVVRGYVSNTIRPSAEDYERDTALQVIERAYRITKGTLEIRPMFHFTPMRIEAHVCIYFVAYKGYKELERILKLSNIDTSVDKALSIAKTVTTIKIYMPVCGNKMTKTILLTPKHGSIKKFKSCSLLKSGVIIIFNF